MSEFDWQNIQDRSIEQQQPNPYTETVLAVLFFAAVTVTVMLWLAI